MLVGKQLKTLIPEWYTPFCTLVSCTGGWYKIQAVSSVNRMECWV